MQDMPKPDAILAAVIDFLRDRALPEVSGRTAFDLRVSINALELVARQIALTPASDAAEHARLTALLGQDGTIEALNARLADQIRAGALTPASPGLIAHLIETTREKLAVDQPKYAAYRRLDEKNQGRA
ncbi:DUF6285 domain-containing protein [Zavarzinia compransoris]|uniref:DUF6285 domain-containing protein n=1 Tax=Zavarzinia compransoris TaxID=1264899 RepID=A0A317DVT5_9PROT|nr:DUF6285 domain-containing protein [Zavarzinia compransoris]PWR17986.1 hypothetical protein DKG75_20815 [Zavarzinia compransoris]TDP43552.1 hypothetical protein DES42_111120 [Zavarzinia compransoris]